MAERELDLLDDEPGAGGVVGHAGVATEARREREAHRPRCLRERALAREGLAQLSARAEPEQRTGRSFDEAEAAALPLGERGDRDVGLAVGQRPQIADEVGVAEDERPLSGAAF